MNPAHALGIKATFQRDGSTRFSDVPASVAPDLKRKTVLKDLILGDWGPTMRDIAWALGHAVMVPAAVAIVFAQWLVFVYRRPLAGALVLVPVRNPGALYGSIESISSIPHFPQPASSPNLADDGPPARDASPVLAAAVDQSLGLKRPVIRPVGPDGLVLAPAPRRQRRRSNRPQGPA